TTAALTTEARMHAGTMMGLLQRRCTEHLLYVLIFLENAVTSALMIYALLWEVGNLVNLPDKHIGFFNLCLGNGKMQCLQNQDLEAMGIS
ncbi:TM140 protein, partial [Grantiella picta]|nr:TM140 protein [Grantiella picta]